MKSKVFMILAIACIIFHIIFLLYIFGLSIEELWITHFELKYIITCIVFLVLYRLFKILAEICDEEHRSFNQQLNKWFND